MAESLRLFFAVWPDETVRGALARGMPLLGPGGRAVPIENLHVTLAFLGNTDAKRLDELAQLAGKIIADPFVLTLDEYAVWERTLVVLTAKETPAALAQLAGDLNAALGQAGFPTDSRPYRAHVTLIRERRRGSGRREGLLAPEALPLAVTPISWPVNDFVLVSSRTRPQGSRYEVLQRWPLAGAREI
ncbi:MAG TPA: RNA 2',3'-cyclic phosphodiesterase [Steroidobacteraceae bacterium]|nr:RNA 2',3'-cyclic phosphodiesterase [Steroidobacteraceae bacterium]